MMAKFEDYYANEIQYLRDAGREFARLHQEEAALLNPDNAQACDPHVERLIENFAFLTSNIRAKLDDEFPELSEKLLALHWPHTRRPVPALETVQLIPDFAQLSGLARVDRGANVKANPLAIGSSMQQLKCVFQTCYDVDLYPLELTDVRPYGADQAASGIELQFTVQGSIDWAQLSLDRIRLHLHGDSRRFVYSLYYHLMRRVARVELELESDGRKVDVHLDAVGFARDEEVVPYERHSFSGFRLLQEYFCFPEKFLYFDLCRFSPESTSWTGSDFVVRIIFDSKAPPWWQLSRDNFRQFCTPIINLYVDHALPIDFTQRRRGYPIYADESVPDAHQVHSVVSVVGRPQGEPSARPRQYRPFLEFRRETDDAYYHVSATMKSPGYMESVLSIATPDRSRHVPVEQELSLDVEVFNGDYPSQLGPGDICVRGDDVTQLVGTVRNLGAPTPVRWPSSTAAADWSFVTHLVMNQLSLSDVDALTGILQLYEWTGEQANQTRLTGLQEVRISDRQAVATRHGQAVLGLDIDAKIDETCFTDLGDAYLFGQILQQFLAMYATINSFVRLRVACTESNELWQWPRVDGRQLTI